MKKRRRLLWQLFPSYLLITLISLLAASWYASEAMRHFFLDQTATDLKARAALLEKQITGLLSPLRSETIDTICKEAGRLSATRITVILPDGTVIGDSRETPRLMDNHANRPEIMSALAGQTGKSLRFSKTLMQRMLYVAVPIKDRQNVAAVLRTSLPATSKPNLRAASQLATPSRATIILRRTWQAFRAGRRVILVKLPAPTIPSTGSPGFPVRAAADRTTRSSASLSRG